MRSASHIFHPYNFGIWAKESRMDSSLRSYDLRSSILDSLKGHLATTKPHTLVLLLLGFLPTLLQPHPGFRRCSGDDVGHAQPIRASRII